MSLKIYLDDCVCSKELIGVLRAQGHDVSTPGDAGTVGASDETHLNTAKAQARMLITADADDFEALHQARPNHFGICAICQDNDPTKDMSSADIVRAVGNLEQSGVAIAGQFWVLNAWRY